MFECQGPTLRDDTANSCSLKVVLNFNCRGTVIGKFDWPHRSELNYATPLYAMINLYSTQNEEHKGNTGRCVQTGSKLREVNYVPGPEI